MKKILALVIAIVMLASISVSALAETLATDDSDTVIEFVVPETEDDFPTAGVHNPGEVGELGNPENDNWPSWVEELHSWDLDFGQHEVPDAVGAVSYNTDGSTEDANGDNVEDRLGLVLQLAFEAEDGEVTGSLRGEFQLTAELGEFMIDGRETMQGFDLSLTRVGDVLMRPAGITAYTVNDVTLDQGLPAVRAADLVPAIWGWEWTGELAGTYNGENIEVGESQAEITWTVVFIPSDDDNN